MDNNSDNYGSGDEANPSEAQDAPETDSQDNTDQQDEPTALVDKAFCPDMKVGQKFTGGVVGVHEDEYEIKYLSPEEDDTKPESTMSKSESALDKMAVAPEAASNVCHWRKGTELA